MQFSHPSRAYLPYSQFVHVLLFQGEFRPAGHTVQDRELPVLIPLYPPTHPHAGNQVAPSTAVDECSGQPMQLSMSPLLPSVAYLGTVHLQADAPAEAMLPWIHEIHSDACAAEYVLIAQGVHSVPVVA